MTLVNTDTGEILNVEAAERRASYICTDLDMAADSFETAMGRMREAIRERDDIVLGYRSPGDYLSDRFGGRLARLGVDLRREVVRELTEAGLSTRAIAPVVGVGASTVKRDAQVAHMGHLPQTPEPAGSGEANAGSGQTEDEMAAEHASALGLDLPEGEQVDRLIASTAGAPVVTRKPVVGIDGKTYSSAPSRARPRPVAERSLNSIALYAGKAAREAQTLTADQIRRVRPEAGHWTTSLRDSIEALQRLVNSLDTQENQ